MTPQQIFDKVAKALIKQGKPSVDANGACMYRGKKDCKCAIGHLVSDRIYRKAFEHQDARNLIEKFGDKLPKFFLKNEPLLQAVQMAHDNPAYARGSPITWLRYFKDNMKDVAQDHGLKVNFK